MSKHPAAELRRTMEETKLPSNVQLEKGIEKTEQVLKEEMKKRGFFAPEYKLAKDTTQFLQDIKKFLEEKNQGDLLQKFILDATDASKEFEGQLNKQQFFIERAKIYQQAQDISTVAKANAEGLKNLAFILVNSPEFRALITEFIDMLNIVANTEKEKVTLPSLTPSSTTEMPLTEEAKLKAQQTKEAAEKVFNEIKEGRLPIPEERKQLVNLRLRQLLERVNADENFQSAVHAIFQIFDQIQFWAMVCKERAQEMQSIRQSSAIWRMWNDGKLFMVNFTGEDVLNKLYNDVWNVYQLILNDQRLTSFFYEFRNFFLTVMQNPKLLDTDEFKKKWNDLYLYAYEWMNDPRYKQALNSIYYDFNYISQKIQQDTLTRSLQRDVTRLARDVVLDESGKPNLEIMSKGLDNLRGLVYPILRKYLENVPIPPFSGTNETYDWQVDGMYINAATIVPENIEVKVWGDAKVSLTEKPSYAATYITMIIRDIGLVAKDLKFHFIRKTIPKLDEKGVADVTITGKGTTLKIVWKIEGQQNQPWVWNVFQVVCSLSDLDITVKESSHTWLMKFITTLFSGSIKRNIEEKIEESVVTGLESVVQNLNEAVQVGMEKLL